MMRLQCTLAVLALLVPVSSGSAQTPAPRDLPLLARSAPASLSPGPTVRPASPPAPLRSVFVDRRGVHRLGRLTVVDPYLATVALGLAGHSPTFRETLDRLRTARIPVTVGTPEQLARHLPRFARRSSLLATAVAIPRRGARVPRGKDDPRPVALERVLVIVDVEAFRSRYASAGTLAALQRDLEIVLAHEMSGHAEAWARSAELHSGCPDPTLAEILGGSEAGGCAVERENRVRRELGVVERASYREMPLTSGESWQELDRTHLLRRGIRLPDPLRSARGTVLVE